MTKPSRTSIASRQTSLLLLLAVSLPGVAAEELADFGRRLFVDTRFSAERDLACATCHDPGRAFSDSRGGATSTGSNGRQGRRNAPALTYAALTPAFGRLSDGAYAGGFFIDGRAANLAEQVREPLLGRDEMNLRRADTLLARIREVPDYVRAFESWLAASALESPAAALRSFSLAIVAYEHSREFMPFDSRYDRYLRGELELSRLEELGRLLFFSDLVNCSRCHLLDGRAGRSNEVFSNHRYHNIGTPRNPDLVTRRGNPADPGLANHPAINDPAQAGRFRVPGLRNVAVTAPYMHNGVFAELDTAVRFYNRYLIDNAAAKRNPETGRPWEPATSPDTIDVELLRTGQPMNDAAIRAIVAFLEALTDQRYERLLAP